MGRTEEYLAKKRTKAARKRLRNTVDFSIGVQAARYRRKVGRRRACEGMCYTLPTLDDPFNDLYKEKLGNTKVKKKGEHGKDDVKTLLSGKENPDLKINRIEMKGLKALTVKLPQVSGSKNSSFKRDRNNGFSAKRERVKWRPALEKCMKKDGLWAPSGTETFETVLCALVNANVLGSSGDEDYDMIELSMNINMTSVVIEWDKLFWEACGSGYDVLATGRTSSKYTAACSVLAAVSHISSKRISETGCINPIVLFIVQSKEYASEVRNICKLIKPHVGFHAVSLHTGTPLQHQIEGLSCVSPEILIATPERLCDLLSAGVISISNVSFMIINEFEEMVSCGFGDQLERIKSTLGKNIQTALLSRAISLKSFVTCRKLLVGRIFRVASDENLLEGSTCINQNVHVVVSEEKKLQKFLKLLKLHHESKPTDATFGGKLVLFQQSKTLLQVKSSLEEAGYLVEYFTGQDANKDNSILEKFRDGQIEVLLSMAEVVGQIDIANMGTIFNYEFPSSIDKYCMTLTRMARNTAYGALHSFCSGAMAPLASQLIGVLQQCLQPIPPSLEMLAKAVRVIKEQSAF